MNGLAWANVDSTCKLNYYVRLSSADKREESKLSLKDYPMKNLKAMALVPIRTLDLQEFYGTEVSGYQVQKLNIENCNFAEQENKFHSTYFSNLISRIQFTN